jgi:hypothetical protein
MRPDKDGLMQHRSRVLRKHVGAVCALLSLGLSAVACTSPVGSSAHGGASALSTWQTVGYGIERSTVGAGNNVLVTYGGYSATLADSQAFSLALGGSASFGGLGVGSVYASQGPRDAGYNAREIGNSELAAQLATKAAAADFIIVVAHSSGAFVADELFTEASSDVLAKIVYFDLDGGSWALTNALVAELKAVYFVDARDSVAGESHNASAIQSLHSDFAASRLFQVDADGSGCNVGATWCLHDTLITTRPHNHSMFDLNDDYVDFTGAGRHVVTSYVDQAVADQVLVTATPSVDAGVDAAGEASPPPPPAGDAGIDSGGQPGADAGSGTPCSTDGDCNTGSDGSGQICVASTCVPGCNADWQCPGSTSCVSGQCQ